MADLELKPEMFAAELTAASKAYERYIVCLDKTSEEFRASAVRLLQKAITAYLERAPGLRHGIALDRHLTIILSQTESDRPMCGVYFNLHSPYSPKQKPQPTD